MKKRMRKLGEVLRGCMVKWRRVGSWIEGEDDEIEKGTASQRQWIDWERRRRAFERFSLCRLPGLGIDSPPPKGRMYT